MVRGHMFSDSHYIFSIHAVNLCSTLLFDAICLICWRNLTILRNVSYSGNRTESV